MTGLRIPALAALSCVAVLGREPLPEYRARQAVAGTIRIWGHGALRHDFMETLVADWESGFRAVQPGVRFETRLHGTASAIGALYAGVGDLALMGREIRSFGVPWYPPSKENCIERNYPLTRAIVGFIDRPAAPAVTSFGDTFSAATAGQRWFEKVIICL